MKYCIAIILSLFAALVVMAAPFTDPADYSTTTTNVNTNTYVTVTSGASSNDLRFVPFGGIELLNTNGATTAIVSVIWRDIKGSGLTQGLCRVSLPVPAGSAATNWLPYAFNLVTTNQHVAVTLDAALSNAVRVKVTYRDVLSF